MTTPPTDTRGLPPGYPFKPDLEYTPADFRAMMRADPARTVLIDVRLKPEWDFARVEGAIHIPLAEIEAKADTLDITPDQTVGVICHHGVRSLKAALALRALGVPQARSIAGGIESWSVGVDPSIPRYGRQGENVWPLP